MKFVAPPFGQIGALAVLVDAIPASRRDVAAHLGITPRTLSAYIEHGRAPRAVLVALFVESAFGRSQIHTQAHNDAVMYAGLADCLRRDVATLQARIARLEALGDFGAANAPYSSAVAATAAGALTVHVSAQRREL